MVLKNRVGITGSSGLLGKHVIKFFLKKNCKVIASSRQKPDIKHKNLVWKRIDLNKNLNDKKMEFFFKDISCLIHIGAYVPKISIKKKKMYINKVNIVSSLSLAAWSNKKKLHFIYISGAAIYKKWIKNSEYSDVLKNSKNNYLFSKIKSEKKILDIFKNNRNKLTILRPSSIFGAGQDKSKLIPTYVKYLKQNKKITIYNFKKTKINLVHAKDVASAVYLSFKNQSFGIYNLGSKKCVNFLIISQLLKKILKSKSKIILKKSDLFKKINPLNVNIEKIKKKLNWQPKINLKEGLEMTIKEKCF